MNVDEVIFLVLFFVMLMLLRQLISGKGTGTGADDSNTHTRPGSLSTKVNSRQIMEMWQGHYQNIPLKFYGGGADHPFEYYFTGKSGVEVLSVDDVVQWLLECRYVSDPEQFGKRDHWQHPVEFENTRQGDCEDFALWAWRKLVELGHEAEFMVGKWIRGERIGTHAWVLLQFGEKKYLFESTGRSPERIMRPYDEAFQHYIPFASVDHKLKKKAYKGIAHWIMKMA